MAAALGPCLPQATHDAASGAAMAKGKLHAMGLVSAFAPLVLLAGHGSQSLNNPNAGGLDCGACGGQTGEGNARVLADLPNTPAVRERPRGLGVEIPARTHFVPALHNTTTDQVVPYDTDAVPAALPAELAQLRGWLEAAGERARAERAASLDLRTGLRKQSLHDSTTLRHTPLRLSLFIEAPRAAIDTVMVGPERVRNPVRHEWPRLQRTDPEHGQIARWGHRGWVGAGVAGGADLRH